MEDSHGKDGVMVVNQIRNLRAHVALDEVPTQQSVESCHPSPYCAAWNEDETDIYDVAAEAGF